MYYRFSGQIERRQAGLLVGACEGFRSFHGEIDDVSGFIYALTHVESIKRTPLVQCVGLHCWKLSDDGNNKSDGSYDNGDNENNRNVVVIGDDYDNDDHDVDDDDDDDDDNDVEHDVGNADTVVI